MPMTREFKKLFMGLAAVSFLATSAVFAQAADIASWQRSIVKVVAQKQVYPRSALRREIEGNARVQITIARDGTIANFEILENTGHDVLDREVPKLMERISPLPAPPNELSDDQLTFILPLAWALR